MTNGSFIARLRRRAAPIVGAPDGAASEPLPREPPAPRPPRARGEGPAIRARAVRDATVREFIRSIKSPTEGSSVRGTASDRRPSRR